MSHKRHPVPLRRGLKWAGWLGVAKLVGMNRDRLTDLWGNYLEGRRQLRRRG
jgi:hypothetical protein